MVTSNSVLLIEDLGVEELAQVPLQRIVEAALRQAHEKHASSYTTLPGDLFMRAKQFSGVQSGILSSKKGTLLKNCIALGVFFI